MLKRFAFPALLLIALIATNTANAEEAPAPAAPAADVLAQPPTLPEVNIDSPEEVISTIKVGWDLARTGQWLLLALLLLQVVVRGIKKYAPKPFMKEYGFLLVTVLGAAVALLSLVAGGLSWLEALVVFASGPLSAFLADALHALGITKHAADPVPASADA